MRRPRRPDRSKATGYHYEGAFRGRDGADQVHDLLDAAADAGTVTEYGVSFGHGTATVWFNGHAGRALRRVRDAIRALMLVREAGR